MHHESLGPLHVLLPAAPYEQARLESQGLPSFRKMSKGLGGKDVVFLWARKTLDSSEFITEIQITHADPSNAGWVCTNVSRILS